MNKRFTLQFGLIALFMLISIWGYSININVGGTISSNVTWNADTVKVDSNVTVNNGATLTITAGTYVQFQGHYSLIVQGRLLSQGTKDDIIEYSALNTTSGWGGIRFHYTPTTNDTSKIEYCRLSYGKANIGSTYDKMGGAIYVNGFSKVIIINNYISNNYASYYGGGIAVRYASPEIAGNAIVNNTSGSRGGGLYIYAAPTSMIMMNNTVANNHSYNSGGVYSSNSTVYLYGSIFWGNTASSEPQVSAGIDLGYSTIQGGYSGTQILTADPKFVAPTSGSGSSYNGITANYQIQATSPAIDNGYQYAQYYGIKDFDFLGNFRFDNSKIDQGAFEYISSTEVCGAITSNTTWSGNVLINCNVIVYSGNTLTIQPGTKIIFTGHYYLRNMGRILAQGTHDNTIDFTAWNKSTGWNGFYFSSVSPTNDTTKLEYCTITYSKRTSGGAFYIYNTPKLLIRNCVIKNNKATSSYGGAMYIYNSSPRIIGNLIINNEANGSYGGGIYIYGTSSSVAPKLYNNTISRNKSSALGCGLFENSSAIPVLKNNIIWDNEDASGNHALIDNIYPTSGLNLTYCTVEGGYTGTGNKSLDPKFKYPTSIAGIDGNTNYVNFALESTSPCIDFGTISSAGLSLPALDINGKTRVFNSRVDMGAYEDKSLLNVCGTISSDQVWDANVININCNVTIANGATVTIIPGTEVRFAGHYSIIVKGALQALGAENDTIVFTSTNTTTGWDGVQLDLPSATTSNDSCIFDYCKFEYAKRTPSNYTLSGAALSIKRISEVRVSNSNFVNNVCSGGSARGGAIHMQWIYPGTSGYPKIINNTFSYNQGTLGTFSFDYGNVIFRGNTMYSNTNSTGAAINLRNAGADVINNFVSNNTGNSSGGLSIQYTYSTLNSRVFNNLFVNNTGNTSGGIYIYDAKPEIYNNTIANNQCNNIILSGAGGMAFDNNADANLKSNIIYGNKASGAVASQICLLDVTSDPKIYNSDIQGDVLSFSGAGAGINYTGVYSENIDFSPSFTSASSGAGTSYNGRTADWSISQGSALINAGYSNSNALDIPSSDMGGSPRIFNGRIDIGAYENQDPIVSPCTISSNTVWEADTIHITCDVTINTGKTLIIKEGTNILFMGHYSIIVDGSLEASGTPDNRISFMVTDTSGFYDENTTTGGWAGIRFSSILPINDSSIFEYCVFTNGKATGSNYSDRQGGIFSIYNSPKVRIENCVLSNNLASYRGGAVFIESSDIIFRNNILSNNSVRTYSGGNYSYGGAMFVDDVNMEFINNTVVNNSINGNSTANYTFSGGIYVNSSTFKIKNSIFWGNTTSYYYNSQLIYYASSSSEIYNSDIQFGPSKIGGGGYNLAAYSDNVDIDPQFINPSSGAGIHYDGYSSNWALAASTPLIDQGLSGVLHTSLDLSGNPRLVSDTLDMGAFEVQLSRKFITQNPSSKSVCEGTSTTFTVGISIPTNYQWMHNGSIINGANGASYTIPSIAVADTGFYYCNMSTSDGSINSDTAQLGIQFSPNVVTSPTSTSACAGDSAAFSVGATGSEPLVYSWQNSLGQLPSSTPVGMFTVGTQTSSNSSSGYPSAFANWYWGNRYQFIIHASELTAAGVTAGNMTSIAFNVLNVNSCPALSNYSIQIGATSNTVMSTTFQSGLSTVYSAASYQPVSGWNNINFQTPYNWNGTSNIIVQICSNNSSYVADGNASIALTTTSYVSSCYKNQDAANVCVTPTGYSLTKRPVIRLKAGTSVLHYYVIDSVLPSDASVYKCNVSNMCGSALSTGAQLTVNSAPSVVPIIGSASVCENQSYTYTTSASGTGPISYQWYKDGSSIGGSTSVSHSISSVSSSDDGIYYCKANNACGSDSTNQSVLSVNLVPSIVSSPSNLTKCENQSAMFSIQASGSPTLTYQWYKGGSPIAGGSNSSLLISPVSTSDAGNYYCKVTNSCGTVNSATATLTVNSNVSITSQSGSQTLCEGSSPTLSITAAGTAPITYQWYNNSGLISGATNNTYSITSVDTSDAGNYYCIATNTCTSVSSSAILLNVNQAPSIVNNPQSATVCANYSAVFTVSANGTTPMNYQWYDGSGIISGATGTSYIIPQANSSNAGGYYVKATNICGIATSSTATLTVNDNVSITAQSTSQTVCDGASPSFSITATGTAPVTYQWYKNGVSISGATNNTYLLTSVDTSDDASYYVIATNSCNSVQSSNMILNVNEAPTITAQPVGSTVCSGSAAQLSVSATGTAPMSYQWYKGTTSISGATNNNYIISSVSSSDAATYYVKAMNSCGTVTSQNVSLVVTSPASITSQSSSQTICDGASLSFNVSASGTGPITYQWYKDNSAISSATASTLSLSSVDSSDAATYYAIASNSCNSAQTNPIVLSVNESPAIITQPLSSVACAGSSAMLSISASGTAPLAYQWYKGGNPIAGGISNTYIIGSSTVSDAGSYYCKVSNSCATVTSNTATLVVNNPAIITSQSGDSTKCVGASMMFSVSTSGTAPITYQWYFNGNAITGGASAVYSIASVSTSNAGDYYCIITNSCNTVQSSMKTLTVNTVPSIVQQSGDTSICSGNNLTLSVSTSGSTPMSYQWYKASVAMGGAVSSLYPMYQISTADASTYYCVASNSCGTAQSTNMVITVNSPPSITYQSADSTRCEGESMTFQVNATGTAPLSYQWYKGQTLIAGSDSVYHISNVLPSDNGNYYAMITNACASITTTNKYLTVHASPHVSLGNDTTFCDGGSVIIGPGYGYYCLWNNSQIASQLNVTSTGSYSASVTDQYGCDGFTDTINVNVILPYANQEVCLVTIDSATGKNVIVWEKTPNMNISSFNVYKESNISGVYSLLANRPYDSLSVVLDLASNPSVNAERYMITVVDSCNNESPQSTTHRTMHLTVNKGQNNDWNLIWNSYEGFTPSSYKIFRADSSLNFVNIATVSGSSSYTYLYTDQNAPLTATVYYYVEVVHPNGGCIATKANTNYHTSRSNHANSSMANPTALVPAFFGTPTSGVFPLDVHFFDQSQGSPIEWEWSFGDGSIDSVQNPTHSYTQIGVYSVSLVVKDATSMNSIAFQNYITVLTTGIVEVYENFDVKVFPNPYTDVTNIAYALTKKSKVHIEIFNAIGVKVADLVNGDQYAGSYKIQFRAADYGFSAGVYYLRMNVDGQLYTKKMVEVK